MSTIFTTRSQLGTIPFPYETGMESFAHPHSEIKPAFPFELTPVFEDISGEEMIDQMLLGQFDQNLSSILNNELRAGNKIAEVWSGWPHRESIFVILEKPFMVQHQGHFRNIEFKEINDPHFWKSEYVNTDTQHCLACRF